jgi:AcrR family transcriptional regulator
MPRPSDPALEQRILNSALHILDTEGMNAVTMRRLAAEASTTTPTLYERFPSRAALEEAIFLRVVGAIAAEIEGLPTLEEMVAGYLDHIISYPHRMESYADAFGRRYAAGNPQPLLDLVRSRLRKSLSISEAQIERLTIAIALIVQGTQTSISAAGSNGKAAALFKRVALDSVRALIASAQPKND